MLSSRFNKVALAALMIVGVASVNAAEVVCGDGTIGIRVTTVDPGLVGGLCYATVGNLDPKFYGTDPKYLNAGGTSIQLIGKEIVGNAFDDPLLGYTILGATYGEWTVDELAWDNWDRVFLGFHFGNARDNYDNNPDSFVIELKSTDNFGTWALTGSATSTITGLSNIYLFGRDNDSPPPPPPPEQIPEPGTLALAGLALVGAAAMRRRQRSK